MKRHRVWLVTRECAFDWSIQHCKNNQGWEALISFIRERGHQTRNCSITMEL